MTRTLKIFSQTLKSLNSKLIYPAVNSGEVSSKCIICSNGVEREDECHKFCSTCRRRRHEPMYVMTKINQYTL